MLIYVYTVDNQDFQGILKLYYVGLDAYDILHLLCNNVLIISANPVRDTINFIRMERNLMVHCSEWMIAQINCFTLSLP
jgi:hypothetical protein